MSVLKVESRVSVAVSPEQAWAIVRDFCAPWHPFIDAMEAEDGGQVRRFTVGGEDTVYRERLTYYSASERRMSYSHLEGIAGVERYEGALSVTALADGTQIVMSAELSAESPRAEEIASGTQVVFDAGTAAIAKMCKGFVAQEFVVDGEPRLAVSVAGFPSETLCLFLHGIGGNRSNWDDQLAAVAPFCRVAALDLRGYGGSELGAAQSDVADYCADILRVMQALGAKKLVLCGLSYGAWIATSFALRFPDRLAGLVLSGGCTGMSEAAPAEREAFRTAREVPLSQGQTPADFAPAVVDVIAGPDASDIARAALLASMQAIPARTYADALRCFTNPTEQFDFADLTMPVLLMTGEHDRLAPPAEIRGVAERIWQAVPAPDVRFEVIVGAGHVCNLEEPAAYNRFLAEFVGRVIR